METNDGFEIARESLSRRLAAMHSLWHDAVGTMSLGQVNHFEREGVLPIAFSLFHLVRIEDFSASMLGAGEMVYDDATAQQLGLTIDDDGKHRTVEDMVAQRLGDYDAFAHYMTSVFAKTEGWLASLDIATLADVVIARPFQPEIASTFSARVAGEPGLTRLDATECWIYQHGLRHMGEIEHARALVGLGGMTS